MAIFEVSGSRLNMDSPLKIPPTLTPYKPPTNSPAEFHTSTECAKPCACRVVNTRSIAPLIQVSGRSLADPALWTDVRALVLQNEIPESVNLAAARAARAARCQR